MLEYQGFILIVKLALYLVIPGHIRPNVRRNIPIILRQQLIGVVLW